MPETPFVTLSRLWEAEPDGFPPENALPETAHPRVHPDDGLAVAAVLDAHFADPEADPAALAEAFCGLGVPLGLAPAIEAAAGHVHPGRALTTGRWLLHNAPDRCGFLVGLSLLATGDDPADIDDLVAVGFDSFAAPAAAAALVRRDAPGALLRLASRTGGWARVYSVTRMCEQKLTADQRHWLLRHSCHANQGLSGYYAGEVAVAADLHEAITRPDADEELVDHTTVLLHGFAWAHGMGMTLTDHPHAEAVLAAHLDHFSRLAPDPVRYEQAENLMDQIDEDFPEHAARMMDLLTTAKWAAADVWP